MRSEREILKAHYAGLLKKSVAWVGLFAVITSAFITAPASAAQLTSRKATLSDSAAGASSVSYDIQFNVATTSAANGGKAVRLQFCANNPIYNTSCTALGGTFVRGTSITTQTDNGGAFTNSYSAATSGTTDVLLTNATGNTFTAAHTLRFVLGGFTNINTANTQFYVRVITCNDTTCTVGAGSNMDNGGIAVSTSQQLSVTANVQEDLTFCVGTSISGSCGTITGTTVTLSPNPMTTSGNSNGTAKMAASTNGTSGYVITYNATTFTDTTSDTIASAPTGGATVNAGGTEQFGFTLRNQTSGNLNSLGTDPTGGTGSATAPYSSQNSTIAYNTAGATQVASAAGPTALTTYTILYAANVATTTKPGVYTANQTFIATATF